jgi:hypothetical protein
MAKKRKTTTKRTLSFEMDEKGEKGGGLPSPIGKSKASSFEKNERNKKGHQSPSLATSKLRAPSFKIVEKGGVLIAITTNRQTLSFEFRDNRERKETCHQGQ